ncbi:MAG TPA: DUF4062 domain-containing protein [Nitrospiraceae bacterium]|nr:DUF4062 domain-containing protein [Nitrospiraceae bacterium]
MKIYISSTYQDLSDHRSAVDRTLRRMGHDMIGMEQYVAEGNKPLERCLTDVRLADLYVVIVAWRYGYVPPEQPASGTLSITELEYEEAKKPPGKPILAFLLDPDTAWPTSRVDAMSAEPQRVEPRPGFNIARFRSLLGTNHLAGMFRTPDDVASQVAAAVAAQGLNRFMVDRVLVQTSVNAGAMGGFGEGVALVDSTIGGIKDMVAGAGSTRAIVVDLGEGDRWWSTRLFLLSSLLHALTGVRQLVFRDARSRFCGMASPGAILDRFAAAFPLCALFLTELRKGDASLDIEREMDRQLSLWASTHEKQGLAEGLVKVGVRAELLERLLGERLIARCIHVDAQGLTMAQVQQIVESPLPDVPIDRLWGDGPTVAHELQVVDRDSFALELAREWVRAGLPRNPIR